MRVEIAEGPGAVVGVAGRRGGARRRGAAAARNGAGRGAAGVAGQPLDRVAQPVAPARRRGLGARQVHPRQGIILSFFLPFFLPFSVANRPSTRRENNFKKISITINRLRLQFRNMNTVTKTCDDNE